MNNPVDRQDLKLKTARGGVYTIANQVAGVLVMLIATPILTRSLLPEDFGVFGMGAFFVGLAAMFTDAGLTSATIQRENISNRDLSNLFWVSTFLACTIAIVLALFAPLIVRLYDEPKVESVVYLACIGFVFAGIRMQSIAILRRNLEFKALAYIRIAALVVGTVVSVLIAVWTRSYLALAIGPVVGSILATTLVFVLTPWRPARPSKLRESMDLFKYGANLTGFQFLNYFSSNADNMLIGAFYGSASLGFYTKAYSLMLLPLRQLNAPFAAVALPALSRLVSDSGAYKRAFDQILKKLLIFTTPLAVICFLAGDAIISIYLGPDWGEAAVIFKILAINCFLLPVANAAGWLYQSQDRTGELFRWGLISAPCIVVSFLIGLPFGAMGVAISYTVVVHAVMPWLFYRVGTNSHVTTIDLAKSCLFVATHAAFCFAFSILPLSLIQQNHPLISIALCSLGSTIGTVAFLWFRGELRKFFTEMWFVARSLG
ncbi:lipopolysaccharide biosynthesis protein [Mariniblastus sp.]|nr:lipopolysaccharide biosynthesis protein [Mariniblastus sp.]